MELRSPPQSMILMATGSVALAGRMPQTMDDESIFILTRAIRFLINGQMV
jgi:hypothetical protein